MEVHTQNITMEENRIQQPQQSPITSPVNSTEGHVVSQEAPVSSSTSDTATEGKTALDESLRALNATLSILQGKQAQSTQPDSTAPYEKDYRQTGERPPNGRGVKTWNWSDEGVPVDQHPAFRLGSQALDLDEGQAYAQVNEVSDIVKMAIEHLENSDPTTIYNFLSSFRRTTDARSVWSLRRELERRIQQERQEVTYYDK